MRRQPGEDLVELRIRDAARNPLGHRRPIQPGPRVAMRLHRIVVRMRSPAAPGPVQRERVHQRATALVEMETVEAAQHRLAVRPHRRRVSLRRRPRLRDLTWRAPVWTRRLARHQQPPAEVSCLHSRRTVPDDLDRPEKPEPAQQIHSMGPQRRLRPGPPPAGPGRTPTPPPPDPGRVKQPERQPRITRGLHRTRQRDSQRRKITRRPLLVDHGPGP